MMSAAMTLSITFDQLLALAVVNGVRPQALQTVISIYMLPRCLELP